MSPLEHLMRQSLKVGSLRAQAEAAAADLRFVLAFNGQAIPDEVREEIGKIVRRLEAAEIAAEAHAEEMYPNKEAA